MSKTLLRSLFRPYICKSCRHRTRSPKPPLRRSISVVQGREAINNAEQVQRRIEALGGEEEVRSLYQRFPLKPREQLLSPNEFTLGYQEKWLKLEDESRQRAKVAIYGRVKRIRTHGRKLAFLQLETGGVTASISEEATAMLNLANLKEHDESLSDDAVKEMGRKVQRGDWVGVRGRADHNDNGQFILRAQELPTFLAPSLQTVPLELRDPEFRMRNRHADQIVHPSERDMTFLRSKLLTRFRSFMFENQFTEVSTPLLVAGAGGAAARPFETEATEFSNQLLHLRVAPELFLKRMIVGGMQRVYEIGPAFRNEGVDNTHNPEFTIAEFYGIMLRLDDLMAMTERLFKSLSLATKQASDKLESVQAPDIDFTPPYPVIPFISGLGNEIRKRIRDWRFPDLESDDASAALVRTYRELGMSLPLEPGIPQLLDRLSAEFLEPRCIGPTFIVHHPECMSPLAKSFKRNTPTEGPMAYNRVSARAELFIQGREYVNCYEEEHSPLEQRRKFEEQISRHEDGESPKRVDESYLSALEWGMPPTGGWGCGIDRIVMLFGGKSRIADVLPFGNLRNVVGLGSQMAKEVQERRMRIQKHEIAPDKEEKRVLKAEDAKGRKIFKAMREKAEREMVAREPKWEDRRESATDEENLDFLGRMAPGDPRLEALEDLQGEGADFVPSPRRRAAKQKGTLLSGTMSWKNIRSSVRHQSRDSPDEFDEKNSQEYRRGSHSPDSAGSEFSLWSDTGDLVDQLADEEDPLRQRLRESTDEHPESYSLGRRKRKSGKRVHYQEQAEYYNEKEEPGAAGRITKPEDIPIPDVRDRSIGKAEKLLAIIMAPGDGPSRMHGLHGKKLVYFTSVFVSLGVFLFGYDQGVMSGIITGPYFKDYFNQPSRAEIGTMVAILEIGALIASLSVGRIGDMIGRRKTIFYGSLVFLVGGACQTFANGMPMMMIGRIVAGLGVGALSTIVPVYQSEISPPHNRGKLACIEFSGNISGYAASVWVDYFCTFIDNDWSWRVPLLMQCVMGGLLACGSLVICESPRWLLDNDHDEEGIVVIANLYGKGDIHNDKAREEYRDIKMDVLLGRQEGERTYIDMFKRYYKRVFIAMSAQALAQLNGINVISYYAPLVFESAGWVGRNAILMTGINGLTYLASTVPPWYLVDKWGRRLILLSGAVAMIISLSAIAYFIYLEIKATPTLVVIFVMIYNAAFGASWGPIPWLYPPEILPLSIRAKGASLSTAANWAFNWLVGEMTPILQEAIQWRLYLLHAFFCACSFVVVWFLYPETANVRLEDMNALFGDATTAMPTPSSQAQSSLVSGREGSPVPSMSLGQHGPDSAIPGLDIDPPKVNIENGKPILSRRESEASGRSGLSGTKEGMGGWISSMVSRARGGKRDKSTGGSGRYERVEDEEER